MKKLFIVLLIAVMAAAILPTAALAVNPRLNLRTCASDVTFYKRGVDLYYKYKGTDGIDYTLSYPDGEAVEIHTGDGIAWHYSIIIQSGDHTVMLENTKINGVNSPIVVKAKASLNMTLVSNTSVELTATGNNNAGLGVEADAKLTINGSGKMTVTGGASAAGIGGDANSSGDVTINGGTITATGGGNAAGIGGGANSSGDVTIKGGTITATGGHQAAGIGGGTEGSGDVTIKGGTITAIGGHQAAGIGGGNKGSGKVTITGGTIIATGGYQAVGIGGGNGGSCDIDISGGTITATGGYQAVGIGGGNEGSCDIDISGGTITATGGSNAAGIGISLYGSAKVNISGGTITATGGNSAAGIHGTINTTDTSIYSGTTADPSNLLSSYAGQSPVHITDGKTNDKTEDLPDAEGNSCTVGAGAEGGDVDISPLDGNQARSIATQVGGRYVAGANVSIASGGKPTGVGFAVNTATLGSISGSLPITDYIVAHRSGNGTLEQLPVNYMVQGNMMIFSTTQAPASASPFVLVMRVGDPPKPPKTGDDAQPWLWAGLGLLAVAGIVVWVVLNRRRHRT